MSELSRIIVPANHARLRRLALLLALLVVVLIIGVLFLWQLRAAKNAVGSLIVQESNGVYARVNLSPAHIRIMYCCRDAAGKEKELPYGQLTVPTSQALSMVANIGDVHLMRTLLKVDPSLLTSIPASDLRPMFANISRMPYHPVGMCHYAYYDPAGVLAALLDASVEATPAWKAQGMSKEELMGMAAGAGTLAQVKVLVAHGAGVDVTDAAGHTPLYTAYLSGYPEVGGYLKQHGAHIVIGERPIHLAASEGDIKQAIRILTTSPVEVNVRSRDGSTPLMLAVVCGKTAMAKMLLQHGANPNIADNVGRTPLQVATRWWKLPMVRMLTAYQANANAVSSATAAVHSYLPVYDGKMNTGPVSISHQRQVTGIGITPDGKSLITTIQYDDRDLRNFGQESNSSMELIVRNTHTWKVTLHTYIANIRPYDNFRTFGTLALTSDSRYLLCVTDSNRTLSLLDLHTGILLKGTRMGSGDIVARRNIISLQRKTRYWYVLERRQNRMTITQRRALAMTARGRRPLPASTPNMTLVLQDFNAAKPVREISLTDAAGVSFSQDGAQAVVEVRDPRQASVQEIFRIIDLADGHELNRITTTGSQGHPELSPDHRYLIVEDVNESKVLLWDAQTGHLLRTIAIPSQQHVDRVFFSPDSRLLIYPMLENEVPVAARAISTESATTITLTDVRSGAVRSTMRMKGNNVRVALTPDNRYLLTTSERHSAGMDMDHVGPIQVWDARTGKPLTSFIDSPTGDGHPSTPITNIPQSPTPTFPRMAPQSMIVTGTNTANVTPNWHQLGELGITPDGKLLVTTIVDHDKPRENPISSTVIVRDARTWQVTLNTHLPVVPLLCSGGAPALTSDSHYLMCNDYPGRLLHLVDLHTGAIESNNGEHAMEPLALLPGTRYWCIAHAGRFDMKGHSYVALALHDINLPQAIREITVERVEWLWVTFSQDGKRAMYFEEPAGNSNPSQANAPEVVRIIDLADAHTVSRITTPNGLHLYGGEFSPDHRYLVFSAANSKNVETILLWDTQTGQLLRTIPMQPKQQIRQLFFSSDSRRLVYQINEDTQTGNGQHRETQPVVDVADVQTGAVLNTLHIGAGEEISPVLTSDSRRLFSTLDSKFTPGTWKDAGPIHVWDTLTGKLVASFSAIPVEKGK